MVISVMPKMLQISSFSKETCFVYAVLGLRYKAWHNEQQAYFKSDDRKIKSKSQIVIKHFIRHT